jgi:hypothetical protein
MFDFGKKASITVGRVFRLLWSIGLFWFGVCVEKNAQVRGSNPRVRACGLVAPATGPFRHRLGVFVVSGDWDGFGAGLIGHVFGCRRC